MAYKISVRLEFEYAHRLLNYEGVCANIHGHHGIVEMELVGDNVDSAGMLIDFSDVKKVCKNWIDINLDHSCVLNIHDEAVINFLKVQGFKAYIMENNP